jgi:hypothetical protein
MVNNDLTRLNVVIFQKMAIFTLTAMGTPDISQLLYSTKNESHKKETCKMNFASTPAVRRNLMHGFENTSCG